MTTLFDILGPRMVGPSSSHTAGACRLGYVVQAILGGRPDRAVVGLHGSFAMTGEGHGTRRAITGGLLGHRPDDARLREAEAEAAEQGLTVEFRTVDLGDDAHPNSAVFEVTRGDETIRVTGCSIGGGQIQVLEIDGFEVDLSGSLPTLVVVADDVPGTVARITGRIAERGLNVATVRVDRTGRGERALMTIETDEDVPADVLEELAGQPWVHWIRNVHQLNA
ncbi:MAG: L-serine ammonia-lyase, iron-sulfur-dependent subunit beta [Candidatus Palauibacterales bacterium]|jgi:L-serine dehydratase|nr:L-serine ammonia-lyase, iron-sulfur-dependent subunit beta [Candidatus Palauibacterales bacterium]